MFVRAKNSLGSQDRPDNGFGLRMAFAYSNTEGGVYIVNMMSMRRMLRVFVFPAALCSLAAQMFAQAQETPVQRPTSKGTAPLKLVGKYEFPSDVKTRFDHVLVEVKSNRVFTTPHAAKSVMVFDLKSRKLIHTISGIEIPHHM